MLDQETSTFFKCRTCFNEAKNLQPLNKFIYNTSQQISYADLLKEVTDINVNDDKCAEMPKHICACCSRRLKSSHAFIKQAKEVNNKLWSLLNKAADDTQKVDCLQECEVDIQTCLEIKMETEEEVVDSSIYDATISVGEIQIKKEFPDDDMFLNKEEDEDECSKKEVLDINNTEDEIKEHIFDSNSSRNKTDFPETVIESEGKESHTLDIQTNEIKTEFSPTVSLKANKPRFPNIKKDDEDIDIAVPCQECNKIFNNSKELNRHIRNTHVPEEEKCACPLCGAKFKRPYTMYQHMRTLHDPESVKMLLPTKEKSHHCDKCPRKYTNKKHLNAHIREKHGGDEKEPTTKDIEEPATDNKKKSDVRPLCFICGESFSNKGHLIVHMRRKHTGERPFKCDLCERAFPRISELTCHRRIHTGEKPYKCKICEKTFRVSTKLATHMRSHTNERPYKCTECERSFKYSKDLNIHNRIHTGERPYCCTVCGLTFTQSNSLKAHLTKHTGHMEYNGIRFENLLMANHDTEDSQYQK